MKTKMAAFTIALGMAFSGALASQKSSSTANLILKKRPTGMSTTTYRAFKNLSRDERQIAAQLLHGASGSIQENRSSLQRRRGKKVTDGLLSKLAALGLIKKKGDAFIVTDKGDDYHFWQSAMDKLETVAVSGSRQPNGDALLAKILELHRQEAKTLPNAGRQDLWLPYERIHEAIDHLETDPMKRSLLQLSAQGLILMVNSGEKVQPSNIAEPY
ncbi:MAG: hypothetical protein AB7V46_16180, partial [Thermomicrobiales bacterium]